MENLLVELITAWEAVRDFLELGGGVLTAIAVTSFVLWGFMLERVLYLFGQHKREVRMALQTWELRRDHHSWNAHQVRERLVSVVSSNLERNLAIIRALVMICPLLGLLGTVTGMVEVFEVMAISGSGNPRSLAAGVSKATVPTMAGMVVALSGLFLNTWLQRKAARERALLGEHMTFVTAAREKK